MIIIGWLYSKFENNLDFLRPWIKSGVGVVMVVGSIYETLASWEVIHQALIHPKNSEWGRYYGYWCLANEGLELTNAEWLTAWGSHLPGILSQILYEQNPQSYTLGDVVFPESWGGLPRLLLLCMLQIPSPPALRLRPVEMVPALLPQNTCPLSSSSQCRGLVKCRNANSIKGYYSQGYSYEVLKAIAARVQMRDSPKSTQVCRASWYTMTGLFESHWCCFLANVSFIQNCFFTAYSPLKSCYKWELCS